MSSTLIKIEKPLAAPKVVFRWTNGDEDSAYMDVYSLRLSVYVSDNSWAWDVANPGEMPLAYGISPTRTIAKKQALEIAKVLKYSTA